MKTVLLVALSLFGCGDVDVVVPEESRVRDVFNQYIKALQDGDGDAAAKLVDENTVKYYARMKQIALYDSKKEFDSLTLVDKSLVLSLRHLMTAEQLKPMSPRALISHAVKSNWLDRETAGKLAIGDINVYGDSANGVAIMSGEETPLKFVLNKIDGEWRFDLTAMLAWANPSFHRLMKEAEMDEKAFLVSIIEASYETKVDETIWRPMIREKSKQ